MSQRSIATDLPQGTAAWTRALLAQQMPALSRTAQAIARCAANPDSSGAELAALVLRDAGMTTKVLRVAGSRLYNPHGLRIRTISRAVAVLGFDAVREVALGVALLDAFAGKGKGTRQSVMEAAQSLQAAVQARALAELAGVEEPEEIFIAALLYSLGRLAFWSALPELSPEAANALGALQVRSSAAAAESVRITLGLNLDELSDSLHREMRLSPLLTGEAEGRGKTVVRSGHTLVAAMHAENAAQALDAWMTEASSRWSLEPSALQASIEHAAQQSETLIEQLFDAELRQSLPALHWPEHATASEDEPKAGKADPAPRRRDPMLALEVLRELGELLAQSKPDPGAALSLVMEGMQRAAGLDRVVFALISPDRKELRLRAVLATHGDTLRTAFPLAMALCPRWPEQLAQARAFRVARNEAGMDAVMQRLGSEEALLAPLVIDGKPLGVLWADRAEQGDALDAEALTMFSLLAQQANLALAMAR
jgi:GAF domain-containing protein